jgi:hypothetical protein
MHCHCLSGEPMTISIAVPLPLAQFLAMVQKWQLKQLTAIDWKPGGNQIWTAKKFFGWVITTCQDCALWTNQCAIFFSHVRFTQSVLSRHYEMLELEKKDLKWYFGYNANYDQKILWGRIKRKKMISSLKVICLAIETFASTAIA